VVDVNTNPANTADGARSFGDQAVPVSALAAASVLGYQSAKVAATANTSRASAARASTPTTHRGHRRDARPVRAQRPAAVPRRDSRRNGRDHGAHIVAPSLDPSGAPASLSKPIVTDLLRKQLHYDGVVVTDALSAAALAERRAGRTRGPRRRSGRRPAAHADEPAGRLRRRLAAVHSGRISEARIDQSVTRLLKLKQKLGLLDNAQVDVSKVPTSAARPSRTRRGQDGHRLDHARPQPGAHPAADRRHRAARPGHRLGFWHHVDTRQLDRDPRGDDAARCTPASAPSRR